MSSFIDIKDHRERDAIVKDYLATVKRIQKRNEEDRTSGIYRQRDLEQHFKPIIQSQDKMTKEITKALKERIVKNEPSDDVDDYPPPLKRLRGEGDENYGRLATEFLDRYVSRDPDIDTVFGIHYRNGEPVIGNTPITIDGDDLIIYEERYKGTQGLWNLLTEKKEARLKKAFTHDDVTEYAAILDQTHALYEDYNPNSSYPRSSGSYKWRKILGQIWKYHIEERAIKEGKGIRHPIPGCQLILKKNGLSCLVQKMGEGLYLTSIYEIQKHGDGLFIRAPSSNLYEGKGIELKIPLLKILK